MVIRHWVQIWPVHHTYTPFTWGLTDRFSNNLGVYAQKIA